MNDEAICAITFLSVHDVLKAEKILLAKNLNVRLIPVPKQVSPECGMALEVACVELVAAKAELCEMQDKIKGTFRVFGAAFKPLEHNR